MTKNRIISNMNIFDRSIEKFYYSTACTVKCNSVQYESHDRAAPAAPDLPRQKANFPFQNHKIFLLLKFDYQPVKSVSVTVNPTNTRSCKGTDFELDDEMKNEKSF